MKIVGAVAAFILVCLVDLPRAGEKPLDSADSLKIPR